MYAILIAIRDVLVAMALAWVGVTLESNAPDAPSCSGESCQAEQSR